MRLVGALGGLADDEVRATFNGGLGMVVVVAPAAIDATMDSLRASGVEATLVGEVVTVDRLGGARYGGGCPCRVTAGSRSRSRAPAATCGRSTPPPCAASLAETSCWWFADRPCPAVDWAAEQGIDTAVVPGGADDAVAETLAGALA